MMIKRIFLALNVSLTAVLILIGLSTLRSLRPVDIEDPPEAMEGYRLSLPQPPEKSLSHYLAIIGQRAWFGSLPPDIDEEEVVMPIETLPRTDLRLRLKGTIYSSPPLSRAIIKDLSRGQQSLYQLGDVVAGAKIVSIGRSRVVIEREGRQEVILMTYGEGGLAHREEPEEVSLPFPLQAPEPPAAPPMRLGEEELASAAEATQEIVRKLHLDRDNLPEAPANLLEAIKVANRILTRARIRPHFVGRRLEGFRMAAIQQGSIYERLGLEQGDIIRGVNGQRINSIRDAFRLFQEFQRQPTVTVDIKRDGQPLSLDFEIR